jgi:hypothetical protein
VFHFREAYTLYSKAHEGINHGLRGAAREADYPLPTVSIPLYFESMVPALASRTAGRPVTILLDWITTTVLQPCDIDSKAVVFDLWLCDMADAFTHFLLHETVVQGILQLQFFKERTRLMSGALSFP